MGFDTIDKILDFAIAKEEAARQLYLDLAERMARPGMRQTFLDFAKEEAGHKAKLLRIKKGELPEISSAKVQNLQIAEHSAEVEPSTNMTYQEALLYAMQAEKAAYKLYSGLAAISDSEVWAELFRALAQEEARHKLRFEVEYDDVVLEGN